MEIGKSCKTQLDQAVNMRGRILELAAGLAAMKLVNFGFDYLLYPFIVYRFGILKGGMVMTLLSFISCLLLVWYYDKSKRDWFGIEAIKKLKEYEGGHKVGRLTAWMLKKSDPVVFIFLSLHYDPFITMAYLRHGAFNGMNKRDWRIFNGSLLFSNLYWTMACYLGISLFEYAVKLSQA
jgi:hypothetical protein